MIKHLFFILTIFVIIPLKGSSQAIEIVEGFGIKTGLNYNSNGDYKEFGSSTYKSSDKAIGYHIGFFGKIGKVIYFRPEFIYTATKSEYNGVIFDIQKVDLPMLAGFEVFGPVSFFAGPSLQYILDSEFKGTTINKVENDFSAGLNIGVAITMKKIGIDFRYERGFSENEGIFVNENFNRFNRIDTRPEQLILSLFLFF